MIVVLNGKKYLNIVVVVDNHNHAKISLAIKKHNVIEQAVLEIFRGGFLSKTFARVSLLVPEENIIHFQKEAL